MGGLSAAPRVLFATLAAFLMLAPAAAADLEENLYLEGPDAERTLVVPAIDIGDTPAAPAEAPGSSLLDKVGAVVASIGSGIASISKTVLGAVADGAVAVGHAIAAAAGATADAAAWLGGALVSAGIAAGHGLVAAGAWLGGAGSWLGRTVASGIAGLATGLVAMWPEEPKHQAIVAGTAAGTLATAGAAYAFRPWRYLRFLPLLAPLYTRIAREELLQHPVRERIYGAVKQHPGVHLSQLTRELDVPWGTLLHHLGKLEERGLVVSTTASGRRCLFLPGQVPGGQREAIPALGHEKARAIANYFAEHPGTSQGSAAKALAISPALLSWHVRRLEKAGVLVRTREGRTQRVGLTGDGLTALAAA